LYTFAEDSQNLIKLCGYPLAIQIYGHSFKRLEVPSMRPEIIVMLTHHDRTVPDAIELFETVKDLPVVHWGFKDIGLSPEKMKKLVVKMKEAGKTTYLEVVSLSEQEGLIGARLAVEAGFDVLMGTVFFASINEFLGDKPVKYYPFPGRVHSHPSILEGSLDEIVAHAQFLEAQGAQGLDLLTYRYIGEARKLLREVARSVHIPVVSAGSIASFQRIAEVWDANAWGFTIGSAFFEKKFKAEGSLEGNIMAVWDWLQETDKSSLHTYSDFQVKS